MAGAASWLRETAAPRAARDLSRCGAALCVTRAHSTQPYGNNLISSPAKSFAERSGSCADLSPPSRMRPDSSDALDEA